MTKKLEGKVAIVTGAGAGIGQAAALRLASEGAAVVCLDIVSTAETVQAIEGQHGRATGVRCDVSLEEDWAAAREAALQVNGRIDILVNVAGISPGDSFLDMKMETLDKVYAVNLRGTVLGMREVLPLMVEQQAGKIINISTGATLFGVPFLASYTASKGGIDAITRQAAVQFGEHNVQVNAICPGIVETGMLKTEEAKKALATTLTKIPMRRIAQPEDLAAVISFLAGPDADYVTGVVVPVDGGMAAS